MVLSILFQGREPCQVLLAIFSFYALFAFFACYEKDRGDYNFLK